MSKQVFVADAILLASQLNTLQSNDFNQTVSTKTTSYTLVAADAGTKIVMNSASATTITVNTSLFAAGDTLTILNIAAGVCTVTAGTATVSTAGTLALVQNAGGTLYFTSAGVSVFQADGVAASSSGLTLITTATPTGVASVSINSCFSSTFDNYRINIVLTAGTLDNHDISMRLRIGGTDTSTNYTQLGYLIDTTFTRFSDVVGTDEWLLGNYDKDHLGQYTIEIANPNKATNTSAIITGIARFNGGRTVWLNGSYQDLTTQFDGFTTLTTGTITGTIKVYGYQNS